MLRVILEATLKMVRIDEFIEIFTDDSKVRVYSCDGIFIGLSAHDGTDLGNVAKRLRKKQYQSRLEQEKKNAENNGGDTHSGAASTWSQRKKK